MQEVDGSIPFSSTICVTRRAQEDSVIVFVLIVLAAASRRSDILQHRFCKTGVP